MWWRPKFCLLLSLYLGPVLATELFEEGLNLRPLRDGKVAAHFSFTTLLKGATLRDPQSLASDDDSQHYTLFPLALGQILREYAVTELHLTLNAGSWDYNRWGYPDEPGVGTGAELWAWIGDGATISVDQRWQGLRNALAGLFCASLGSLDEQRTTSPVLTFTPEGNLPNWTASHQLRHATLPSEHVCTENLTPFLKLLPCKSLSGIASLLNPHRLFDADWHGLGVHVRYLQDEGVEVRLAFQAVLDPVRYSPARRRDWSLRSLFDRVISTACPVAHSSVIRVDLSLVNSYSITPTPTAVHDNHAVYPVVPIEQPLDIAMDWPAETTFQYPLVSASPLTPLSIQRTLKGWGQSDGQLSLVITNHLPVPLQTGYLETMPWLLQFYLHTLHAQIDGTTRDDLVKVITYAAPVPHAQPALLQAVLTLPPRSTLRLTMDVAKPFLRYTEHPPDAQRGWDLPPAVFVPFSLDSMGTDDVLRARPTRIYTPALLVDLATPDFSMPYNVIIMSCTLIALMFGSIFNLLTRKFAVVHVGDAPQ
ncbi:Gpi16 subunit GPI transamidase component [Wolfiporia cocos MD-104 SS10]|uniref:Gpi16 subunit GPI transamidase component n=1 Tax=Wolfiporia cocos (strain MD-104) TaxID=742152 RepID=A0A2H3JRQ8_WOLCO|nr:Gpi16 subunit GPI transamidase component [Wolfiporia cocos MD-104 SS10]